MEMKIYVSFLILYSIFCQGIGVSSEENDEESSDLHVRKKRIINMAPGGDRPVMIERVPYIVNIFKNGKSSCAGSILTPNIIITVAHCVLDHITNFQIISGSSNIHHGTPHYILFPIFHPAYHLNRNSNDLVLLIIYPLIDLINSPNRPISLHGAPVPDGTLVTVSGWGSTTDYPYVTFPEELRSTTVPLYSLRECANLFESTIAITEKCICTLDINAEKCCGPADSGAPLVFNGQLIGVHTGSANLRNGIAPDIYMNVSHPEFRNWIHFVISQNPPHNTHNPSQSHHPFMYPRHPLMYPHHPHPFYMQHPHHS